MLRFISASGSGSRAIMATDITHTATIIRIDIITGRTIAVIIAPITGQADAVIIVTITPIIITGANFTG